MIQEPLNQLQRLENWYNVSGKDDDISLIDIWLVIVRRKTIILCMTLIGMIAGGVVLFLIPPIYKSDALVEIGFFSDRKQLFENPITLARRIEKLTKISVTSEKGSESLLAFKATDNSPAAASEKLSQIVQEVVLLHKKKNDENTNILMERLRLVKDQIRDLNIIKTQLENQSANNKEVNSNIMALLLAERSQTFTQLVQLQRVETELLFDLARFNSNPTQIIIGPTRPEKPSKLPFLYAAFSTILGGMVGVVIIFFVEVVSRARKYLNMQQIKG